ncbi:MULTISPECIES: hypothetical protein [Rodentibacter]|uniref:hypothetical protein n=1 Tax=Rodentibacter TaxID=1960084 RepID=UPI001CFE82D4|nr:hypothetical protein [Rodentibacter sp. JRC1]GJI56561.1 hypothetical protein HEMROJRC1_16730 [Rodentibacter sp. JRC1]
MKKLLMTFPIVFLVACSSTQPQQDNGIYDMKTVQEYQARVASGNTVTAEQKANAARDIDDPIKVNASDSRPKVRYRQSVPVVVMPSVGFGYYRGYHHRYW